MSERVRLTRKDLWVGMTVPWNIYDLEGRKLLGKGQELRSDKMLDELCQYVLYHDLPVIEHTAQKGAQGKVDVFIKTAEYIKRIERIFNELEEANPDCNEKINNLTKDILSLCEREPDAILAAVHVDNEYPYVLFHPLQCAYVAGMVARRAGFTNDERFCIIAAAIISNVGMRYTQDKLSNQKEPLKPEQTRIIKQHPQKTVDMLLAAGFENKHALCIIMEHHERCDGSGYPQGHKREEICRGALVLAIADRYGAMVSNRGYRAHLSGKEALQHLFKDQGHHYDVQFSQLLIKELTVYPPGTFVQLTNGEIAIVISRGKMSPMEPLLKSIVGQNGELYANPLVRDLSMHNYTIKGQCDYKSEKMLNYSKIWSYS